jgi:transposase
MTKVDREALAKRIVSFYANKAGLSKSLTCQHFTREGIPRTTIYNIIAKYEKYGKYEDLPRSGRPPKINTQKVKRLEKMVNNTSGIGQSTLANKFGVHQSTISRVLKNKTDIRDYKKRKTPKYENNQQDRAVTASRRMVVKLFKDKDVVLDDEKYFKLSNPEIPGNDIFYTSDRSTAPAEIKYKMVKKYESKVMVWLAISSNGLSAPYICESKNSIDSATYIRECLKRG